MANKELGEIEVTLRGKSYVLCFDLNAMESICDRFGVDSLGDFGDIGEKLSRPSASDLKFMLAIGLQGGGQDISEKEVGHLVTLRETTKAVEAMGEALAAATRSLDSAVETAHKGDDSDDPLAVERSPLES
jgi:hypothetical protein